MTVSIAHTEHESKAPDLVVTSNNDVVVYNNFNGKRCIFCGRTYHQQSVCLAREAACYSCGIFGHFSVSVKQRSNKKGLDGRFNSSTAEGPTPGSTTHAAACFGSLIKSFLQAYVNGIKLTALINSGSLESYINFDTSKKLGLDTISSNHNVPLASSA